MLAYFDTFSGASGDMILGSLLDAGLSLDDLRSELDKLHLDEFDLSAERVVKNGIAATQFDVRLHEHEHGHPPPGQSSGESVHHAHRALSDVCAIIDASGLSELTRQRARSIFVRLAEAEAAVHGTTVDAIYFHEVGAVDAIVDICGAAVALERLGIDRIVSGPLRFGSGTIKAAHGVLPLPAPATARLAQGFPVEHTGLRGELTTPTGAAILTTLAESFGPPPPMTLTATGFGSGRRDRAERPNVLRVLLGTPTAAESAECGTPAAAPERVVVIETNLDDATPEVIGHACEMLRAAGALDVCVTPVQMKKSRPGAVVTVLARPQNRDAMESILFRETPTFGVRWRDEQRRVLDRSWVEVELLGETVRVKLGRLDGDVVTASPEYEDCARVAAAKGVPLREIYTAALELAQLG
jgi:hypothetical protein